MTIGTEKKKIENSVNDLFFQKKWSNIDGALAKNKSKKFAESIHQDAKSDSFMSSLPSYTSTSSSIQYANTIRNHRVFVGTWNVGGIMCPEGDVNLQNWVDMTEPADVYVLGFQEIVPLNTGNVLYNANDGDASARWEELIGRTLNKGSDDYITDLISKQCGSQGQGLRAKCQYMRAKKTAAVEKPLPCNNFQEITHSSISRFGSDLRMNGSWSMLHHNASVISPEFIHSPSQHCHFEEQIHDSYVHVASKQMVGLYMTIWIRRSLRKAVGNLKISCVSLGLMGLLGNKGAISISMSLHQTSFCFVCSHLTSGEKEEHRLRRNADVAKILRKTYFPSREYRSGGRYSPQRILAHEKVIWLGDLNFRLRLNLNSTMSLLKMGKLETLLENDQLKLEQKAGHVFDGWNEGLINFAPTYKYELNSDCYTRVVQGHGKKCRKPAWCDRILWTGEGLKQISYSRSELLCSDHRPVTAIFIVEVKVKSEKEQLDDVQLNHFFSPRLVLRDILLN